MHVTLGGVVQSETDVVKSLTEFPKNGCQRMLTSHRMLCGDRVVRRADILKELNVSPDTRTKDLTTDEANKLRETIEKKFRVEGELRHLVKQNIKRLKEIGSFRGSRHQKGLPSRGQRTKTNTRTVRGNTRKTMGSGRKKSDSKT